MSFISVDQVRIGLFEELIQGIIVVKHAENPLKKYEANVSDRTLDTSVCQSRWTGAQEGNNWKKMSAIVM